MSRNSVWPFDCESGPRGCCAQDQQPTKYRRGRASASKLGRAEPPNNGASHLNHDTAVFDRGFIPCLADASIQTVLATGDLKLPTVPWTRNNIAAQASLSQRTACMRANSVQDMDSTVHVEHCKDLPFSHHLHGLAGREIREIQQRNSGHDPEPQRQHVLWCLLRTDSAAVSFVAGVEQSDIRNLKTICSKAKTKSTQQLNRLMRYYISPYMLL